MIRVMLSLDLAKASDERDDFNKLLAKEKWKKLSKVDTVWVLRFDKYDQSSFKAIQKYVTQFLLDAAKKLKLEKISFVAQIGDAKAIGCQILKENGSYITSEFDPYVVD